MQIAPNNKALASLQYVDKDKFIAQCQAALKKNRGHRVRTAKELKISLRALMRWLARYPEILRGIDGLTYTATKQEMEVRTRKRMRTLKKGARA